MNDTKIQDKAPSEQLQLHPVNWGVLYVTMSAPQQSNHPSILLNQAYERCLSGLLEGEIGPVARAVPPILASETPYAEFAALACHEYVVHGDQIDVAALALGREAFKSTLRAYVYSGLAISQTTVEYVQRSAANLHYSTEELVEIFRPNRLLIKGHLEITKRPEMRQAILLGQSALRQFTGETPTPPKRFKLWR